MVSPALYLGGAGYAAKQLYNWYQRRQKRLRKKAVKQKEKDVLIYLMLEGISHNPNITQAKVHELLAFFDVYSVGTDELDRALATYKERHLNKPYPAKLHNRVRNIFLNPHYIEVEE